MNIRYPAIIEHQDEGGFTVSFPDIDEAITEGDSLEAALFNATDVLTLTIESRIDEGMNIPCLRLSAMRMKWRLHPKYRLHCWKFIR